MPTRNRNSLRIRRKNDDWEYETAEEDAAVRTMPLGSQTGRRRGPKARLALVAAFTSLFFAGAAFTAGAGDQLSRMLEPDDAAALQAGLADAAAVAAEAPAATVESAPAAPETAPVVAPEAGSRSCTRRSGERTGSSRVDPRGRCRRRNGRCSRDAKQLPLRSRAQSSPPPRSSRASRAHAPLLRPSPRPRHGRRSPRPPRPRHPPRNGS